VRISRFLLMCSELLLFSGALALFAASAAAQGPLPAGPMQLTQPAQAVPGDPVQATQQKALRLLNESQIRLPGASPLATLGAPQCSNNGALFVQLAPSGKQNPGRAPVFKISPAGVTGPKFSLDSAPGFELSVTARTHQFAVSGDGNVYFLVQKDGASGDPALYVIHFAPWGQYLGKVKLSELFVPRGFAVLPGGGYFVLGLARDMWDTQQGSKSTANSGTRPVGAFYGPKGKLRYELNLPGAVAPAKAGSGAGTPAGVLGPGRVAVGADGAVYVTRYKPAFSLYVIARGGASVRSVKIEPPIPHAAVMGIAPAGPGKVVMEFARHTGAAGFSIDNAVFSIISAETGERLVDYSSSPQTTGTLGCYTLNGFELFSVRTGDGMAIRFVRGE
jgi:hypothetical protein